MDLTLLSLSIKVFEFEFTATYCSNTVCNDWRWGYGDDEVRYNGDMSGSDCEACYTGALSSARM